MKTNSTKEKIIYSMYEHVGKLGYDATALSMIADDLGIKKASIYYHFKTKESIYIAVFEEILSEAYEETFNYSVTKENYVNELLNFSTNSMNSILQDELFINVMIDFYIQSKKLESVRQILHEFEKKDMEEMISILQTGVTLGIFDSSFDVDLEATILLNTMEGLEYDLAFSNNRSKQELIWKTTVMRMLEHNKISH
jgi:AcrR family transcriptional regulator